MDRRQTAGGEVNGRWMEVPLTVWAQLDPTDPLSYPGPAWSPYLAGALLGILAVATLVFAGKAFGASGGYATLAGMAGRAIAPRATKSLPYFQENPPEPNWGLTLLLGLPIGAFLAAWSGGELTGRWLPPMWIAHFGENSWWIRLLVAFAGGALMAFGARLAGGCTSGHGISGTLQLSVGSWIALAAFFIGGVAVAALLYEM